MDAGNACILDHHMFPNKYGETEGRWGVDSQVT